MPDPKLRRKGGKIRTLSASCTDCHARWFGTVGDPAQAGRSARAHAASVGHVVQVEERRTATYWRPAQHEGPK